MCTPIIFRIIVFCIEGHAAPGLQTSTIVSIELENLLLHHVNIVVSSTMEAGLHLTVFLRHLEEVAHPLSHLCPVLSPKVIFSFTVRGAKLSAGVADEDTAAQFAASSVHTHKKATITKCDERVPLCISYNIG